MFMLLPGDFDCPQVPNNIVFYPFFADHQKTNIWKHTSREGDNERSVCPFCSNQAQARC